MIIVKDIEARVDVSCKDISDLLNNCGFETVKEVVSKLNDSTLSYISTYYVNKIKYTNKEEFDKFANFVNSFSNTDAVKTETKTAKKVDVKKNDATIKELEIGDSIFILQKMPGYVVDLFNMLPSFMFPDERKKYKKYTVVEKRSSVEKTGDAFYVFKSEDNDRMIDFHSNIQKAVNDGIVTISRKSTVKKTL